MTHKRAQWLPNPCRLKGPQCFGRQTKSEMAHMWAHWLPYPCRLGPMLWTGAYVTPGVSGVRNSLHEDKIRNGPQVGKVAT